MLNVGFDGIDFNCYRCNLQLVTWLGTDETKRNTAEPAMYISILMFILYSNNNNNTKQTLKTKPGVFASYNVHSSLETNHRCYSYNPGSAWRTSGMI